MTKGKKQLYKPVAHSDVVMRAKELIAKANPLTGKLVFNETVLGGRYSNKVVFDLQFGSNKSFGDAHFEADLVDNQWIFNKATADYNIEQRGTINKISKSLIKDS